MSISNNILSFNNLLEGSNPSTIILQIAEKARERRLELNLTQRALATRSGVTLSSYRRFETSGEISFKSLVQIAIALDNTEEFATLFTKKKYQSIKEVIESSETDTKKRGRRND